VVPHEVTLTGRGASHTRLGFSRSDNNSGRNSESRIRFEFDIHILPEIINT